MNPYLIVGLILAYFLVLMVVSHFTSRKADNSDFFSGKNQQAGGFYADLVRRRRV